MNHRRHFFGVVGSVSVFLLGCGREEKSFRLSVGQKIPTFELPALNGVSAKVLPTAGPYLLNFWATWCPPCRAEMTALNRVHEALSPYGLKVLGISVDSDQFLVREYVLKEKLSFPILFDNDGRVELRKALNVSVYPTSFLVDSVGQIIEILTGEQDWDSDSLRKRLGRLIVMAPSL